MYLEREIKKLFEDARDALLAGGAKDFETYATLNARLRADAEKAKLAAKTRGMN